MHPLISLLNEICQGNMIYEYIVLYAISLQAHNQTMTFRELINLLDSKGLKKYGSELGIAHAISTLYTRTINTYRDYKNDPIKSNIANNLCEAIANAYVGQDGYHAWGK